MPPTTLPTRVLPINSLHDTVYQPVTPRGYRASSSNDENMCFITFPQFKTEELARDGQAECMCTGWFKGKFLSRPGFPLPVAHLPKLVYEVRGTKDSGLGLFATEDIKAGDLIIAERPLVLKSAWFWGGLQDVRLSQELQLRGMLAEKEKALETICSRMSPENLKMYTSLHNSHKADGSGPLTGILRTNSFDVGVDDLQAAKFLGNLDMARYACVGALSSRLNHNCSPNTVHTFNMSSFSMEIHAVRDVVKGEELTVTYGALEDKAAQRQTSLKPYSFTCVCPPCKDPLKSDEERKRALESLLPKTSQGVESAEATLVAFEATGLQAHPRYVDLLRRVAQIRRKKGNKTRANALETLADRVYIAQRGRESVAPEAPATNFTFGSTEDMMKFIMQHENPAVRANMVKAFMQIMAPGASSGTQVTGPNGMGMTMHASDVVDLSGSSS